MFVIEAPRQLWTPDRCLWYTPELARSLDRARECGLKRPFRRNRRKGPQGSRCDTGAAPATVTGDKVRQIHWVKSLGRVGPRMIRKPGDLPRSRPAPSSNGKGSVRLAIPR